MRALLPSTALIVLATHFACMSSNNRARLSDPNAATRGDAAEDESQRSEGDSTQDSSAPKPTPMPNSAAPESLPPPIEEVKAETAEQTKVDDGCENLRRDLSLPFYLKDINALVVRVDQRCKKDAKGEAHLSPRVTAIGVPHTEKVGLVTRKGHSNTNWEVIAFPMEVGATISPEAEAIQSIKKNLGLDVALFDLDFVPLNIEYWEFLENNDADTTNEPRLTVAGGGAKQWQKGIQKQLSLPILLYGSSSSLYPDANLYEAKATIIPQSNQRRFHVSLENLKILSADEIQAIQERCESKVKNRAKCRKNISLNQ